MPGAGRSVHVLFRSKPQNCATKNYTCNDLSSREDSFHNIRSYPSSNFSAETVSKDVKIETDDVLLQYFVSKDFNETFQFTDNNGKNVMIEIVSSEKPLHNDESTDSVEGLFIPADSSISLLYVSERPACVSQASFSQLISKLEEENCKHLNELESHFDRLIVELNNADHLSRFLNRIYESDSSDPGLSTVSTDSDQSSTASKSSISDRSRDYVTCNSDSYGCRKCKSETYLREMYHDSYFDAERFPPVSSACSETSSYNTSCCVSDWEFVVRNSEMIPRFDSVTFTSTQEEDMASGCHQTKVQRGSSSTESGTNSGFEKLYW